MRWKTKEEAHKAHVDNYKSNNVAKNYGSPLQPHYNRIKFIADNVLDNSYVLDVGCNAGAIGKVLNTKGCHVLGIDLVPELVEEAKKNGTFAEVGQAEDLSAFKSDAFDAVVCTEVIEHLYDPLPAVIEAVRVLKKGGVYVVTVPYFGGKMANKDFLGDYHQKNYTYEELDTLFHAFFDRGKVGYIEICYPQIYCAANGLEMEPQWVGIVAEK